jgi:hypothetical protein
MNRLLFTFITLLFALTICPIAEAQNLLPGDSSFEAGPAGWLGGQCIQRSDAKYGKHVLVLNQAFNHSRIYDGLIQPNKTYTLSFFARNTNGGSEASLQVHHVRYAPITSQHKLKLTSQWQQFHITLPGQSVQRTIYITVNQPQNQTIELDGMMLNEGSKPLPFEPENACIVDISPTNAPGNILYEDEPIPAVKIGVYNGTTAQQNGNLEIVTRDGYGHEHQRREIKVRLEQSESQQVTYQPLMDMQRGYFQVIAQYMVDGHVIDRHIMPFGVVAHQADIRSEDSSFGIHPDTARVTLAAMPRIGARWMRVFGHWEYIQRKREEAFPKDMFDEALKNDLSVLYSFKIAESMPQGPWQEDTVQKHRQSLNQMIQWLGKHAPKAIKVWEIENEPDLGYPTHLKCSLKDGAKAYGQVLNVAAQAFKQYCPDQAIAAMAVSGNEQDNQFITQANLGNEELYDIASVHPYNGARYIGPSLRTVAPDAYIREHMIDKASVFKDKQLWAGEIGWAYDTLMPMDHQTYQTYSDYVARAMILMKSVPQVKKIIWFKSQGCYERDHYHYGLWRSEFEPTAAAVFFANIARQLEGATPYKPVYDSDLQVYTFTDRDGQAFAAAWQYKGQVDQMLLDHPASSIHVTDLYGNPVNVTQQNDKAVIGTSSTPVWIRIDHMNVQQLADKLQTTQINIPAVAITPFMIDEHKIVVFAKNNLQQTIPLTLRLSGGTERQLNLAASQVRSITLENHEMILKDTLNIDAITPGSTQQHAINMQAIRDCPWLQDNHSAFEELRDKGQWINLHQRGSIYPPDGNIGWDSAADLSGQFACGYDNQYFYFMADVTDPVQHQTSESYRAWNGDSLQLTFDTLADAREGEFTLDNNDCELIAWLSPSGPKVAMTHSSKDIAGSTLTEAQVQITRKDHQTLYQLAIPWDHLEKLNPMAGRLFGFNFIVNQNNGRGRRYWLGLTEGIGEGKYPYLYNTFRLTTPEHIDRK